MPQPSTGGLQDFCLRLGPAPVPPDTTSCSGGLAPVHQVRLVCGSARRMTGALLQGGEEGAPHASEKDTVDTLWNFAKHWRSES